jgi:hypothetical protein
LIVPTKEWDRWKTCVQTFGVGWFGRVRHTHHHQEIQVTAGHVARLNHFLRRAALGGTFMSPLLLRSARYPEIGYGLISFVPQRQGEFSGVSSTLGLSSTCGG